VSLRVVSSRPGDGDRGARILASGAPPSPGPVPKEYARHLQHGEALLWWGEKDRVQAGPLLLVFAVALSMLGFATVLAPEFWVQPWASLWPPIAVLLSPALLILVRERINQCAVLVTDAAILGIDRDGTPHRLPWGAPVAIRRDFLRGGLVLRGRSDLVRIPPPLLDDARRAVGSQARHMISGSGNVDDPTGWLP
jgi:hypothetical protein